MRWTNHDRLKNKQGDSANLRTATLSLNETTLIGLVADTSYSLLR